MTDTAQTSSRCQAVTSGVPNFEASWQVSPFGRPQPGQPIGENATQPSSTPALPTQDMRRWLTEPQARRWYYYDPTQTRHYHPHPMVPIINPGPSIPPASSPPGTASLLPPSITSASASTSPAPPTSPVVVDPKLPPSSTTSTGAGTSPALPADPTLTLIVTSLNALQFQFATFRDNLSGVQLDLKDALAQLQALRAAQTKTDKSIAELESVVGVDSALTASTRSRGRTGYGRARGKGGKAGVSDADAPLDDEAGATDGVSEGKTLVQSVAAIQATIEALLARDGRASDSHLLEGTLSPSTNPVRLALPLSSIVDPSLRHLTAPPTHSNFATSSASQSELSSPLSPIVVPISESATSPPPAVPTKEYTDVSIQARSPSSTSEPSCSLLNAHRHVSGLVPVDWSTDLAAHGRYASNLVRPTAFTAEYLALFLRDAHLHSPPNSATDSQTPQSDLSPLPGKPVADILGAQRAKPNTSSSSDTSPLPSASGSACATQVSLRQASTSIQSSHPQAPSLVTEGADRSMSPPWTGQPGGSQTLLTSPLMPLSSSTRDTPNPKQLRAEMDDSEDIRMPSDVEGNSVLVTGGAKLASGITLAVSDDRRESSLVAANGGGLQSRLATSPSESVNKLEPQVAAAARLTTGQHDTGIDPTPTLHPRPAVNFPVTPTQPSLTPEASVGEDRGALVGPDDADVGCRRLGSPGVQTPLLFYPILTGGELLTEDSAPNVREETRAHTSVEEHTCSLNEGEATKRVSTNVRAIVSTNAPLDTGDIDVSTTPRSSARQPDAEQLSALDPDANDVTISAYSFLQNAYGRDIRFSSPLRHPSPSATTTPPSRYVTPSETQDEDELWRVLMPGSSSGSEVSTPLSLAGVLSPDAPLPWVATSSSSTTCPGVPLLEQASVDLAVLHDLSERSSLVVGGHEEGGTGSPCVLERSSSPLTSLSEMMDIDEEGERADGADATPHNANKTRTPISTPRNILPRDSASYRGRMRRSELHRAASEATIMENGDRTGLGLSPSSPSSGQGVGGPSVSLDELVMLARRVPLKIHLRIPDGMRGVKRKRDENVGEGEGAGAPSVDDERRQVVDGSGDGGVEEAARRGDTSPARTAEVSVLNMRTPTSTVSRLAPKGSMSDDRLACVHALERSAGSGLVDTVEEHPDRPSDSPPSRKRTRKESERGKAYAQSHHKKPQQRREVTSKSPASVHAQNGQPVTMPGPQVPMSATRPEGPDQDAWMWTPTRMRQENGLKNQAMKTPSSPLRPSRSSWRSPRGVKSSSKESEWDAISRTSRKWPQLPPTFDQWDCQFIQCDNCDKWYHYGCVGIKSGDPRLKPAILFICPTCHAQSARRQTLRNQNDTCARPDCPEPQLTQDSGLFFIERLIGRKKIEGYGYMWLAKWEGYSMTEATWIPKENVVGDGEKLFDLFIRDANEEGADLSQEVILLQEAMNAGWASET